MSKLENHFKAENELAIGVDLGGSKIGIALVKNNGEIEKYIKIPTFAEQGKELTISRIKQGIYQVIEEKDLQINNIAGIGIGAPGPVDYKEGVVHCAPNLPGWKEVPLANIIKDEFQIPVILENDANVAAWGEKKLGVARGIDDMVCLALGTGIGAGLILGGKIYHGKNNLAGEIGHIIVNKEGPRCNCGNYGCLEAYSSAAGIKNRIYNKINSLKTEKQAFSFAPDLDEISLVQIFKLARRGNEVVKDIVEEAIEYLGIGIATVINILNPEMVVLVGGLANEGEKLLTPLKEIIYKRAMSSHLPDLKIVFGKLGDYAGVIGAAALFWNGI
jgi:glucokinase